jgi:uncharacterized Fe-S cluster protein YjdI
VAERAYENSDIRVFFDRDRCIHSAHCLRGLPSVFDTDAKPWINVDGADAAQVASTIRTCPSGALRYETIRPDVQTEVGDEPTTVEIRPGGPLYIRGQIRLTRPGGDEIAVTRAALCRCGASENKPFCDNSHQKVGFKG